MGWRFRRRPTYLLLIALASSLGAAFAVAAIVVKTRNSTDFAAQPLTVRAQPASHTVTPGASAEFSVRVMRRPVDSLGLGGRTKLSVGRKLPPGTGVSFTPPRALASSSQPRHTTTLTVSTEANTPPGTYVLLVRAQRPHRSGSTAIGLTVSRRAGSEVAPAMPATASPLTTPDAFTLSGALANPLAPGTEGRLDLTLSNRESTDLSIGSLTVRVGSVSSPHSDPAHPCSASDFLVEQFAGAPGFTLPALSTASLGELGFAPAEWPRVAMLNLPVNQDGCKQASLVLSFSGTATEARP